MIGPAAKRAGWIVAAALVLPAAAGALELRLPSTARLIAEEVTAPDSYALPVGVFAGDAVPVQRIEGRVSRQAWQLDGEGGTTLQLLAPLRAQLLQAGFEILLECEANACGGFDFRFDIEVLPAPRMQVSLGDFRHISARRGPQEHLSLLVSRVTAAGFVQLIRVMPADSAAAPLVVRRDTPATVVPEGDLAARLLSDGHAVLDGLEFATGASDLQAGPYRVLDELARFMMARPTARIALVGHTDAVGGLAGNVALSRRRAAAVMERLASIHAVPRNRMEAEGVGYLAPLVSNISTAGREANRRVEVVLLDAD